MVQTSAVAMSMTCRRPLTCDSCRLRHIHRFGMDSYILAYRSPWLWHGAAQQNSTDAVQTSDTVHDAPVAAAAAAYA